MKFIIIEYSCASCGHDIELEVTPYTPAQTYGPPENCYPEEGGEINPEQCPNCDKLIDVGDAQEKAADQEADQELYDRNERE